MGIADRKSREKAEREQRIIAAARAIATSDGWAAVTIRRLADEIEFSQPVLYSHFANRDAIIAAVAAEGFAELATALQQAGKPSPYGRPTFHSVVGAYLEFARTRHALYEAMFTMPTNLHFAHDKTRFELRDAFVTLAAAFAPLENMNETATETIWATLHGLAELERAGRIRPAAQEERLKLVVDVFARMDT